MTRQELIKEIKDTEMYLSKNYDPGMEQYLSDLQDKLNYLDMELGDSVVYITSTNKVYLKDKLFRVDNNIEIIEDDDMLYIYFNITEEVDMIHLNGITNLINTIIKDN